MIFRYPFLEIVTKQILSLGMGKLIVFGTVTKNVSNWNFPSPLILTMMLSRCCLVSESLKENLYGVSPAPTVFNAEINKRRQKVIVFNWAIFI